MIFGMFGSNMRFFCAWQGLEMVRGWIPLHLDQVSAQMDHAGSIWVHFWFFGPKMGPKGPGRASIGSRDRFRFIWTKFQPKWAHLGPNRAPFSFSISQKPILGPNSSKSTLGPGAIGPRAPSNMGSRAHGGRRPTFRRGVGGRSPPTATRGVWGAAAPPHRKESPGAIGIYWQ